MTYKNVELPDDLQKRTIKFIKYIIDCFDDENRLNKLDYLSLYVLAGNFDTYLTCEEHVKKHGLTIKTDRGNETLSPYARQLKLTQNSIMSMLKEFGLTLYSRSKLKGIDTETTSPLENFFGVK